MIRRLIVSVLAAPLLVGAVAASADAVVRPKLLRPKANAKIRQGHAPRFIVRDRARVHKYGLWITISKSRKRDRYGLIHYAKNGTTPFRQMRRVRGSRTLFRFRPKRLHFKGYFLDTPGVYYWQVYRIDTSKQGVRSGYVRTAVRRFRVVPRGWHRKHRKQGKKGKQHRKSTKKQHSRRN